MKTLIQAILRHRVHHYHKRFRASKRSRWCHAYFTFHGNSHNHNSIQNGSFMNFKRVLFLFIARAEKENLRKIQLHNSGQPVEFRQKCTRLSNYPPPANGNLARYRTQAPAYQGALLKIHVADKSCPQIFVFFFLIIGTRLHWTMFLPFKVFI